jgi:hypothetical protein
MKNKSFVLAALAAATIATGCSKSSTDNSLNDSTNEPSTADTMKTDATNAWEKTKEVATNAWDSTKTATAGAWEDMKDSLGATNNYAYDQKDQFVAKAKADLSDLDNKIQSMGSNADASLQQKRAALDQKLTDVENATQDNWNDTKAAFASAYYDVKHSLRQLWNSSNTNGTAGN